MKKSVLIFAIAFLLIGTVIATDSNLPGGTSISVEITEPSDGAVKVSPPGEVDLAGTASVGEGLPDPNTLIVYVLDVSGSTAQSGGCGGDQNGDGNSDYILDCEIYAAKVLNGLAVSTGTVGEVGMAVFASSGAAADVGPGSGELLVTGPDTDAGGSSARDVEEVMSSAFSVSLGNGGVSLFTGKTVGMQTNFADGLAAAVNVVGASSVENRMIVFISDGGGEDSVMLGDLSTVSVPEDVLINAFAIGAGSSCSYGTGTTPGSLDDVAAKGADGSSCTYVEDIEDLPNIIPEVIASELTSLSLSIDGAAYVDISGDSSVSLPVEGPVTTDFERTEPLSPGIHELCVKATGKDSGGDGTVIDCIEVTIATIELTPEEDINEMPAPDHTVTATVAAGSDDGVAGIEVLFEIVDGPNEGGNDIGTTDANGETTFTYSAVQGLDGLGTDIIRACFGPDEQGDIACDIASKEWVDTTPPDVSCLETVNPSGKKVPPAGSSTLPGSKGGLNEDGFYELIAEDLVDPAPQIYVTDTGSGTVFGPYSSGTKIKYTEDSYATPEAKMMGGPRSVIQLHIIGNGDPGVYAVDASGNTAVPVLCPVPSPPK